jgi:hypothetical protein
MVPSDKIRADKVSTGPAVHQTDSRMTTHVRLQSKQLPTANVGGSELPPMEWRARSLRFHCELTLAMILFVPFSRG